MEVYAGRFVVAKELHSFRYFVRFFNTLEVEGLHADGGPGFFYSCFRLFRNQASVNGKIAFVARGVTYRFGADLQEDEAQEIAGRLEERLPQTRGHP